MSGASEIHGLAMDLGTASARIATALYDTFKQEGDTFTKDWSANAASTSGAHGIHYPKSITSETRIALGIHVETGPDSSMMQGGMGRGFEFGSRNQPPHLDGLQALGPAEARLGRAAQATIGFLLP